MEKVAFIMRGLPGSGKSTIARHLIGDLGVIHSTDDFFVQNGKYYFDPEKLRANHDKNFRAFCESIAQEVPVVVCDNTNSKHWEYKRYLETAQKAGYMVSIVFMPHPTPEIAAKRNTHNVPIAIIVQMKERWEY
jgi:predicted kinase